MRLWLVVFGVWAISAVVQAADEGSPAGGKAEDPAGRPGKEPRIWAGLVYGSKSKPESPQPAVLRDLAGRMEAAFGFPHFELLGQHTQIVYRQYDAWVVPSHELFLKIDSKGPAKGGGHNLSIQLWQQKKVLVKGDAVLKPGSPLFIGGPNWRNGRLILAVMLEPTSQKEL